MIKLNDNRKNLANVLQVFLSRLMILISCLGNKLRLASFVNGHRVVHQAYSSHYSLLSMYNKFNMFNMFLSRISFGVFLALISPIQATDYTRMAQDIARDSVSQRDSALGDAQNIIENTKNQKYPSFFGFDEETKEPVFKTNDSVPLKKSGKTCKASKMSLDSPKARYQGDKGLYIFVSLSLPDEILKALSEQAKAMGGNLVIQGLENNSFKETQARLRTLGIPIDIDPTLFERFEVKRVPTFVLTEVKEGEIQGPYDKVTGNVSARSAVELFAVEGELLGAAQNLLQTQKERKI
ncbi:MAG TPA: type-F conjugative transfer system pilin assembly protein TrbC [Holosporales bacterium]|nr:type-F conjugative transfer system pilin assembly protein TrbC [Holosporales bacterium]